ncbi:hypothetical protein KI387_006886, partial [Taxus chinensis]
MSFKEAVRGIRPQNVGINNNTKTFVRLLKEDPQKTPSGCMKVVADVPVLKIPRSDVQGDSIQTLQDKALIV